MSCPFRAFGFPRDSSCFTGTPVTPEGLRHSFGVRAFQAHVPAHLIRRWLGHASLRTTAIYAGMLGPGERAFAARMWTADDEALKGRVAAVRSQRQRPTSRFFA